MKNLLYRHETYVFLAIIIFVTVVSIINPAFFTLENFFDLLKSASLMGTFAIGMLFVLISGGIDISFTAIATVSGYTIAVLLLRIGDSLNIILVFLIAALIGIALGMINALIIHNFKIPSIITTIATQNIFYGILTVITTGTWLYGFPKWFGDFATIRVFTFYTSEGVPYGLSIVTVIWIALILISWFILKYTVLGRGIYAMGGNTLSAQRTGFNLFGLTLFVYSWMGLMAGIGSVIQALLVQTVAPNSLVGKEMDVIAAVVLGGASMAGGSGSVLGMILGVTMISILGNGMTIMRVPAIWYNVVIGLVIIVSVGASAYRRKIFTRRKVITETTSAGGQRAA
ncbi:MAG: ABC transporter permease [Chloroflexota bacterium]|nr:ABC transporter permease [Chloroflexota bacterium]